MGNGENKQEQNKELALRIVQTSAVEKSKLRQFLLKAEHADQSLKTYMEGILDHEGVAGVFGVDGNLNLVEQKAPSIAIKEDK